MPLTDAQAEAGKAVAETTGKALDLTKGIGSFIADTIGTIPQDLLGLVGGDWLHHVRRRNVAQLELKTARILEGIEKDRISEPSPSVVMPLLEAARDESREELQELWAALLAQAALDRGAKVRKQFIDIVKGLEPDDILVLRQSVHISDTYQPEDWEKYHDHEEAQPEEDTRVWMEANDMPWFRYEAAREHLVELKLLGGIAEQASPTALARAFLNVCEGSPPQPQAPDDVASDPDNL